MEANHVHDESTSTESFIRASDETLEELCASILELCDGSTNDCESFEIVDEVGSSLISESDTSRINVSDTSVIDVSSRIDTTTTDLITDASYRVARIDASCSTIPDDPTKTASHATNTKGLTKVTSHVAKTNDVSNEMGNTNSAHNHAKLTTDDCLLTKSVINTPSLKSTQCSSKDVDSDVHLVLQASTQPSSVTDTTCTTMSTIKDDAPLAVKNCTNGPISSTTQNGLTENTTINGPSSLTTDPTTTNMSQNGPTDTTTNGPSSLRTDSTTTNIPSAHLPTSKDTGTSQIVPKCCTTGKDAIIDKPSVITTESTNDMHQTIPDTVNLCTNPTSTTLSDLTCVVSSIVASTHDAALSTSHYPILTDINHGTYISLSSSDDEPSFKLPEQSKSIICQEETKSVSDVIYYKESTTIEADKVSVDIGCSNLSTNSCEIPPNIVSSSNITSAIPSVDSVSKVPSDDVNPLNQSVVKSVLTNIVSSVDATMCYIPRISNYTKPATNSVNIKTIEEPSACTIPKGISSVSNDLTHDSPISTDSSSPMMIESIDSEDTTKAENACEDMTKADNVSKDTTKAENASKDVTKIDNTDETVAMKSTSETFTPIPESPITLLKDTTTGDFIPATSQVNILTLDCNITKDGVNNSIDNATLTQQKINCVDTTSTEVELFAPSNDNDIPVDKNVNECLIDQCPKAEMTYTTFLPIASKKSQSENTSPDIIPTEHRTSPLLQFPFVSFDDSAKEFYKTNMDFFPLTSQCEISTDFTCTNISDSRSEVDNSNILVTNTAIKNVDDNDSDKISINIKPKVSDIKPEIAAASNKTNTSPVVYINSSVSISDISNIESDATRNPIMCPDLLEKDNENKNEDIVLLNDDDTSSITPVKTPKRQPNKDSGILIHNKNMKTSNLGYTLPCSPLSKSRIEDELMLEDFRSGESKSRNASGESVIEDDMICDWGSLSPKSQDDIETKSSDDKLTVYNPVVKVPDVSARSDISYVDRLLEEGFNVKYCSGKTVSDCLSDPSDSGITQVDHLLEEMLDTIELEEDDDYDQSSQNSQDAEKTVMEALDELTLLNEHVESNKLLADLPNSVEVTEDKMLSMTDIMLRSVEKESVDISKGTYPPVDDTINMGSDCGSSLSSTTMKGDAGSFLTGDKYSTFTAKVPANLTELLSCVSDDVNKKLVGRKHSVQNQNDNRNKENEAPSMTTLNSVDFFGKSSSKSEIFTKMDAAIEEKPWIVESCSDLDEYEDNLLKKKRKFDSILTESDVPEFYSKIARGMDSNLASNQDKDNWVNIFGTEETAVDNFNLEQNTPTDTPKTRYKDKFFNRLSVPDDNSQKNLDHCPVSRSGISLKRKSISPYDQEKRHKSSLTRSLSGSHITTGKNLFTSEKSSVSGEPAFISLFAPSDFSIKTQSSASSTNSSPGKVEPVQESMQLPLSRLLDSHGSAATPTQKKAATLFGFGSRVMSSTPLHNKLSVSLATIPASPIIEELEDLSAIDESVSCQQLTGRFRGFDCTTHIDSLPIDDYQDDIQPSEDDLLMLDDDYDDFMFFDEEAAERTLCEDTPPAMSPLSVIVSNEESIEGAERTVVEVGKSSVGLLPVTLHELPSIRSDVPLMKDDDAQVEEDILVEDASVHDELIKDVTVLEDDNVLSTKVVEVTTVEDDVIAPVLTEDIVPKDVITSERNEETDDSVMSKDGLSDGTLVTVYDGVDMEISGDISAICGIPGLSPTRKVELLTPAAVASPKSSPEVSEKVICKLDEKIALSKMSPLVKPSLQRVVELAEKPSETDVLQSTTSDTSCMSDQRVAISDEKMAPNETDNQNDTTSDGSLKAKSLDVDNFQDKLREMCRANESLGQLKIAANSAEPSNSSETKSSNRLITIDDFRPALKPVSVDVKVDRVVSLTASVTGDGSKLNNVLKDLNSKLLTSYIDTSKEYVKQPTPYVSPKKIIDLTTTTPKKTLPSKVVVVAEKDATKTASQENLPKTAVEDKENIPRTIEISDKPIISEKKPISKVEKESRMILDVKKKWSTSDVLRGDINLTLLGPQGRKNHRTGARNLQETDFCLSAGYKASPMIECLNKKRTRGIDNCDEPSTKRAKGNDLVSKDKSAADKKIAEVEAVFNREVKLVYEERERELEKAEYIYNETVRDINRMRHIEEAKIRTEHRFNRYALGLTTSLNRLTTLTGGTKQQIDREFFHQKERMKKKCEARVNDKQKERDTKLGQLALLKSAEDKAKEKGVEHRLMTIGVLKGPCRSNSLKQSRITVTLPKVVAHDMMIEDTIYDLFYKY